MIFTLWTDTRNLSRSKDCRWYSSHVFGFGLFLKDEVRVEWSTHDNLFDPAMTGGTVKVLLVHAMKAYGGSGAVPPLILNFGTWVWVGYITPWPFYPQGISHQNTLRWEGLKASSYVMEKRKIFYPCQESNSRSSALSMVTILTELFWVS